MTLSHHRNSFIPLIRLTTALSVLLKREKIDATPSDMSSEIFENANKIASKLVHNSSQQKQTAARSLDHEVSHG